MKIIKVLDDGVQVDFYKPYSLNGGIKSRVWFLSWKKLEKLLREVLK